MNIIFFGTPGFAAQNLLDLCNENHNIMAIVSAPDKEKGRGKKIISTAVKQKGEELGIEVLTPLNLKDEEFIKKLKSYNADLFVVVAFRMLPKSVWSIPKKGTINLHTSLLPNYRGAAPINRVLINNEKETGITTFYIDDKIDCGEILFQEKVELDINTTAAKLHNILMNKGSDLLVKTITNIEKNNINPISQNNDLSITEAPKLTKEIQKINWDKSALEIHNLVRGLSPSLSANELLKDVSICPSAWFTFKNPDGNEIRTKLLLSEFNTETNNNILRIESDNKSYLKVNLKEGSILIKKLQISGKNPMNIKQFLLGNKINEKWEIL